MTEQPDELLSRDQVAELLGLDPEYVRKFLSRRGVQEQRGYRRSDVEPLIGYQPRQGCRTDLHGPPTVEVTVETGELPNDQVARWSAETGTVTMRPGVPLGQALAVLRDLYDLHGPTRTD